jgi:hypothetical protein
VPPQQLMDGKKSHETKAYSGMIRQRRTLTGGTARHTVHSGWVAIGYGAVFVASGLLVFWGTDEQRTKRPPVASVASRDLEVPQVMAGNSSANGRGAELRAAIAALSQIRPKPPGPEATLLKGPISDFGRLLMDDDRARRLKSRLVMFATELIARCPPQPGKIPEERSEVDLVLDVVSTSLNAQIMSLDIVIRKGAPLPADIHACLSSGPDAVARIVTPEKGDRFPSFQGEIRVPFGWGGRARR